MSAHVWAVVPAGGVGSRMGAALPKQYLQLLGIPVIQLTLERLFACDRVERLVLGISRDDEHWRALGFKHSRLTAVVDAGEERVDTVENCLHFIMEQGGEQDWALVHDAARPCVRPDEIERLIETVQRQGEGGILAVPVSDTLKRSHRKSVPRILETVPRDDLWRAMTPQLFRVEELLNAIQSAREAGVLITDEASAMEAAGIQPLLQSCSPDNIKITLPQDIQFAEMSMRAQEQENDEK